MTKLDDVLEALKVRRPSLIDLGLERMVTTLRALGDPHLKLPPFFHVAGTNGKGSTVAYLKAILEASGARVHVFTSPHLVRFNERIVLAGEQISDEALIEYLAEVDEAAGDNPLSFFETTTCAALVAFAKHVADYCLVEVGLGGRLDSTNVVENPLASVVTPIALDHQSYLGDTLAKIAGEKAGIFKKNAPAVIAMQTPEAMVTLREKAEMINAPVHAFGTEWSAFAEQGRLVYQDDNGLSDLSAPKLYGAHQYQNAGLAVAAIKRAKLDISDSVISKGDRASCVACTFAKVK